MFARPPFALLPLIAAIVVAAMLLGAQSAQCFVDHFAATSAGADCAQVCGENHGGKESSVPTDDDAKSTAHTTCCHAHAPLAALAGEARLLAALRFSLEAYAQRDFPCAEGAIRKIDYPPQRC